MAQRRNDGPRRADDAALWQHVVGSVARLQRRPAVLPRRDIAAAESGAPRRREPPARFAAVDRGTAERLKRGLRPIEACLDLHGMTQAEAHRALGDFVRAARAAGRRSLLVITGRGTDRPGTLRRSVPRWLDEGELRRQILAVAAAQPRHGGVGALYVLLRRAR
jgi:DNA-nicking Smr family endonuclease